MTTPAPEPEITWTTPVTTPATPLPTPPTVPLAIEGKHAAPGEDSTENERPDDEQSTGRHAAPDNTPRTGGRRRTTGTRVSKVSVSTQEDPNELPKPKVRAPDFSEWHEYFGDFVVKWLSRGYIAFIFRGVDRHELLSKADNEALQLTGEARSEVAKPLAHLASRNKTARKYGRTVIDSSEGVEAFIALGQWMARVNRIAIKYRHLLETGQIKSGQAQQSSGTDVSGVGTTESAEPEPSANGFNPAAQFTARGFGFN